jgi:hypothetical protein
VVFFAFSKVEESRKRGKEREREGKRGKEREREDSGHS